MRETVRTVGIKTKNQQKSLNIFWFRRDLRLFDNHALFKALRHSEGQTQGIFIFDTEILRHLGNTDKRVQFIYDELKNIKFSLQENGGDLWIFYGKPKDIFSDLVKTYDINCVFANGDYEPAALTRDASIEKLLKREGIDLKIFKDQVIFEKSEILTDQKKPYSVFTPFKRKWLQSLTSEMLNSFPSEKILSKINKTKKTAMPTLLSLGFRTVDVKIPSRKYDFTTMQNYSKTRDLPYLDDGTTRLGIHLRFGTISIRETVKYAEKYSSIFLSELIWREFFMQVLWHHPRLVNESYRLEFEDVNWRKSSGDFKKWCSGKTGYPLVDAGMRELVATGFMHNRVRMVTASFLCKHLLIYWSEGERFFAKYLLDYDLSANNGNWQWAAGTGCDAAPYFRVFNPEAQREKFDPDNEYIKKWIPEYGTKAYPKPLINHSFARNRALTEYGQAKQRKRS